MPADILPAADRRRAATLMLAVLDGGGGAAVAAVIDEANEAGRLPGLITVLLSGSLELLIGAAGGVDGARTHLNLQILNAEADE